MEFRGRSLRTEPVLITVVERGITGHPNHSRIYGCREGEESVPFIGPIRLPQRGGEKSDKFMTGDRDVSRTAVRSRHGLWGKVLAHT